MLLEVGTVGASPKLVVIEKDEYILLLQLVQCFVKPQNLTVLFSGQLSSCIYQYLKSSGWF